MPKKQAKSENKVCKRCGRTYTNAIPRFRNLNTPRPELLHTDIATDEYCANCNRVVMSAIFRNNSVYFDPNLPFGGTSQGTQPKGDEYDYPEG